MRSLLPVLPVFTGYISMLGGLTLEFSSSTQLYLFNCAVKQVKLSNTVMTMATLLKQTPGNALNAKKCCIFMIKNEHCCEISNFKKVNSRRGHVFCAALLLTIFRVTHSS